MPPDAFGILIPGFFFTVIVSIISFAVVNAAPAFTERLLAKGSELPG